MALIDRNTVQNALEINLRTQLQMAAEELVIEAGQELTSELRRSIEVYCTRQAQKMAIGIKQGMESVFVAVDENTNRIQQLQDQINGLATTTTTP